MRSSSTMTSEPNRPLEPLPGELEVQRADIKDELEVLTSSRNRYRWVAGAFAASAALFGPLGLRFNESSFLVLASVGLLASGLAVVVLLRKLARVSELTTQLLSIEMVSARSLESDQ